MEGVIIVDKPQGWTSFDVVAKIRNLTGVKKVGHSGTLDPMATGVLPVFIGRGATKHIDQFLTGDKGYLAEMTLGIRTDTQDADGQVIQRSTCLPAGTAVNVQLSTIEKALEKYRGEIEQVPPMYSAIKINGERLYKLAREGKEVERQPRKITIHVLRISPDVSHLATDNRISLEILCSKGTYIRQLVSDIGDDLGCGAHLSKLQRTYAHPFKIEQAHSMDSIVTLAKEGKLDSIVLPINTILTPVRLWRTTPLHFMERGSE